MTNVKNANKRNITLASAFQVFKVMTINWICLRLVSAPDCYTTTNSMQFANANFLQLFSSIKICVVGFDYAAGLAISDLLLDVARFRHTHTHTHQLDRGIANTDVCRTKVNYLQPIVTYL